MFAAFDGVTLIEKQMTHRGPCRFDVMLLEEVQQAEHDVALSCDTIRSEVLGTHCPTVNNAPGQLGVDGDDEDTLVECRPIDCHVVLSPTHPEVNRLPRRLRLTRPRHPPKMDV